MKSSSMHRFKVIRQNTSQRRALQSSSSTQVRSAERSSPPEGRKLSVPACDRCRRLKKKCSRTAPECELCSIAGESCSLSTFLEARAKEYDAIARLEWLSDIVDAQLSASLISVRDLPTGTDLYGLTPTSLALESEDSLGQHDPSSAGALSGGIASCETEARSPVQSLPNVVVDDDINDARIMFVNAYFRHVHKSYPFAERAKVEEIMKASDPDVSDSTWVYLICAIGSTTLERAGQVTNSTLSTFKVSYFSILQECLMNKSIKSLEILLLLGLYSLFDPNGLSTSTIVGILTRQAIDLGISRNASIPQGTPQSQAELRHRLFWSIFVFDRMMAVSLGLPCALTDSNMDLPLPGVTIEEFGSSERIEFASVLQISRHLIQLRGIEGDILTKIHMRNHNEIALLTPSDRKAMSSTLRSDVENWYSNACLVALPEADNVPLHNTIPWINCRYYSLLVVLYYPCQFNSRSGSITTTDLLSYAQKFVQYLAILQENRQLPSNVITLNSLLPASLLFIHCYRKAKTVPNDVNELSIRILERFPQQWRNAHRAAGILRRFNSYAKEQQECRGPFQETWIHSLEIEFGELMKQISGQSCCYPSLTNE